MSLKSLLLLLLPHDEAMSQQTCQIISALSYAWALGCLSWEGKRGGLAWKSTSMERGWAWAEGTLGRLPRKELSRAWLSLHGA